MTTDSLGKLYGDMGEVKKQLPTLKKRCTKLENRLDCLEALDFELQITNIDKMVRKQEQALLETQRFMARLYVDERLTALTDIILTQNKYIPFNKKESAHNELINNASNVRGKIDHANSPLELAVSFNITAQKRLVELGFEYINIP